jgi:hypothetical protein
MNTILSGSKTKSRNVLTKVINSIRDSEVDSSEIDESEYHLVNKYMHQSSEAFLGLGDECRREVLGPWPRVDMIVSADSFSDQLYARFF